MLPVSADVKNDDDLRFEALDLAVIIGLIENKARVSLLFLDACREDPFKQRLGISRDMPRAGLAAAPVGTTSGMKVGTGLRACMMTGSTMTVPASAPRMGLSVP